MADDYIKEFPDDELEKIREWFRVSYEGSEIWRIDAKEDYSFVEGYGQWPQKEREKLEREERPALVMNAILPTINLISGQERASRLGITFKPRGMDDDSLSMVANSSYKYMADTGDLVYETSHAFADMCICGQGYLHPYIDNLNYDDPMGEVIFKRTHPLSWFIDPASERYDKQDARWAIYAKWVNEDSLRLHYDSMEDVHPGEWLNVPAQQTGEKTIDQNWRNTRTGQIRLLECWYKVPKKVWLIITSSGEVQRFETKRSAQDAMDAIASFASSNFQPVPDLDMVDKIVNTVKRTDITWWAILKRMNSPYHMTRYPLIPLTAYNYDERLMGVVRSLKDPAREKNKRWSQMLHIVSTMAKSGWKIPKGSISEEQFKKWGAEAGKPGFYFQYNPQIGEPKEITGQNLPTSFISLMQIAEEEIRKTSGAIQELMGQARGEDQSGKALKTLQKSGATILAPLFDSLVRSNKSLGKMSMSMIKQFYTPEKILEVMGPKDIDEIKREKGDVAQFIDRALKTDYDTVVDITPLVGSERERQFAQVISLMEASAKTGMSPPPWLTELMLEISDFPNKDRYLAQIRQAKTAIGQGPLGLAGQSPGNVPQQRRG